MAGSLHGVRVLVTGAAGFIGSHLTRRLVSEGAEVHALDVPSAGPDRLGDLRGDIRFHPVDLLDADAARRTVREAAPARIFHLASHTNVQRGTGTLDESIRDLQATANLLKTLESSACECFVQTGTCEEYGDNPAPFREDQMPNPVSAYSASKAAATLYSLMLRKTMGLPVVVLRPFLTYGPSQNATRFIPCAILAALAGREFPMTEGRQTREFNYVSDIVDAFVLAAITPAALGEVINVGNGIEYSLREVVEKIAAVAGTAVPARFGALPYRAGEAWHFYCDNAKARRLLGWAPRVDLDAGLGKTVAWYREQGALGAAR